MMNKFLSFTFCFLIFFVAGYPSSFAAEKMNAEEKTNIAESKSEKEIPLNFDATGTVSQNQGQSGKLFLTLVILLGVFGSAYFFIKKYAFSNKINKSNMQIKILAQHYLGPKKSLAIIHVAGESMLVGVTDHNISMIKSLSLIDDEVQTELGSEQFEKNLTVNKSETLENMADDIEDEFSFSGLRSTVSQKIKSMRNM